MPNTHVLFREAASPLFWFVWIRSTQLSQFVRRILLMAYQRLLLGFSILFIKSISVWGMREVNKQCRAQLGLSNNDTCLWSWFNELLKQAVSFGGGYSSVGCLLFGVVWVIVPLQMNSLPGLWQSQKWQGCCLCHTSMMCLVCQKSFDMYSHITIKLVICCEGLDLESKFLLGYVKSLSNLCCYGKHIGFVSIPASQLLA